MLRYKLSTRPTLNTQSKNWMEKTLTSSPDVAHFWSPKATITKLSKTEGLILEPAHQRSLTAPF